MISETKPKIGIDIDEVVAEFFREYLKLFNNKFRKNLNFEEIIKFNIWDFTDISREACLKLAEEFNDSEDFFNIGLVDGAKYSLIRLNKEFNIYFITSRPESIREKTVKYMADNFPGVDFEIVFSSGVWGEVKSKAQICRELGIKILIEDRRKTALECAQEGIKIFLMDKPWNRENCEHENIIRVKNWGEILEKLESEK